MPASGLNLRPEENPPSSEPFPLEKAPDPGLLGKPSWIMLVEDNPADVTLIREALYEYGVDYQLTVIADGERALQVIDEMDKQSRPGPDLVLLDLRLPKRSGREVLERVHASAQFRLAPVVILTSSNEPEDRESAARLGATRYIRKPNRLDEFVKLGAIFKEVLAGGKRQ